MTKTDNGGESYAFKSQTQRTAETLPSRLICPINIEITNFTVIILVNILTGQFRTMFLIENRTLAKDHFQLTNTLLYQPTMRFLLL